MKRQLTLLLSIFLIWNSLSIAPSTTYAAAFSTSGKTTVAATESNSYSLIKAALLEGAPTGKFDPKEIDVNKVGALINQVVQENPEILYYKSAIVWTSGKIEFTYYVSKKQYNQHQLELNNQVQQITTKIKKTAKNDFDKVKAVHDYLVLNTAYDYVNQQKRSLPETSYTAYGALVKGIAVCDGYTKAAQLLLNQLGITNQYVFGNANGELHSWNEVKINNKYYFLDTTWDDPVPNQPGKVNYQYFLTTSAALKKDHAWDESKWPQATDNRYAYFVDMEGMVQVDQNYYYSSQSDNHKLYKISVNGKRKTKINNVSAPYFVIIGKEIYFSNYSNNGYLYKMTLTGENLKQLNSIHSIQLQVIKNNQFQFLNQQTNAIVTYTTSK